MLTPVYAPQRVTVRPVLWAVISGIVYAWVFMVSSIGHRSGALPRAVTRFGLLLGASFPLGLLIFTAGLLGWGSRARLAWLAAAAWLALPGWPLVLARLVFRKGAALNPNQKGIS